MKNSAAYRIQKTNSVYFLELNQAKYPLFKNQKIRQTMALIINRQQLTKKIIGNGTTAIGPVTAAGMTFDPAKPQEDFASQTQVAAAKYQSPDLKQVKTLWQRSC
ncbi:hypothetical protein HU830_00485 [Lactobacillus sp. DCY120]|uniref:Solute-binding protein family 5 domain-containing protein n=1 Tax=Bombilactobacillus apium TaxID=2675299 RepID=A0A850R8F7_9LACO|nr:ABC transporter substrate-binding protein [Bombilactobacillus apium]NVY95686.1 hypothetical protein [Bombilactobacillus apium]